MIDVHLDCETFSEIDLTRVGAFRYARHPSTEILILCWAIGDSPVRCWSPYTWNRADDDLSELFYYAQQGAVFAAHNAQFEFAIWKHVGPAYRLPPLPPQQWRCTAARAAMCSLPRSLEGASRAVDVNTRKDPRGKQLMRMFSMLQKDGTRILPADNTTAFEEYVNYCADDVVTERELDRTLPAMPDSLQTLYTHDLVINDRGFCVDVPLIQKAVSVTSALEAEIKREVRELTGGINPTQRDKLLSYLQLDGDLDIDNLQAETLRRVVLSSGATMDDNTKRIIELRLEGSRASTKKLRTMLDCADPDDHRVRGAFLVHGAHTGRWTGRLVQPHNFIRGLLKLPEQQQVFTLLDHADADSFSLLYSNPMSTIAQCMRGFIVPRAGHRLLVADYSSIEARILSWFAEDEDALTLYREGADPYRSMAAAVFGVAYEDVTDEQRRIGKNLILGCGFGLGYKKFVVFSDKNGVFITEDFSKRAVNTYRSERPLVVALWRRVNNAAMTAVSERTVTKVHRVQFDGRDPAWFRVYLPSMRALYYPFPRIEEVRKKVVDEETGEVKETSQIQLTYVEEYQGKFIRTSTYGGKLVENIVQGIAADVLMEGMGNAEAHDYPIVLHVHDELVSERPHGEGSAEEFSRVACTPLPKWIDGCPIEAKGFTCSRYRKDG